MAKSDHPISFRADTKLKAALEKAAKEADRSVSWIIAQNLTEAMKSKGHLKR